MSFGVVKYSHMSTAPTFLDRFLEPVAEALTPQLAETLINLRSDAETEARIDVLREKAKTGVLTADEEAEYREFVEALDVISIIQAKARQFLARQSNPHG